jgi:hypothetical protein
MYIYLDCISCFIRQPLDAAKHAAEGVNIHENVVRGVLALANNLYMSQSLPVNFKKYCL